MEEDFELRLTSLMINFDVVTRNCRTTADLVALMADTIDFADDPATSKKVGRVVDRLRNGFIDDFGEDYARPILDELEQKAGRMYRLLQAKQKARAKKIASD